MIRVTVDALGTFGSSGWLLPAPTSLTRVDRQVAKSAKSPSGAFKRGVIPDAPEWSNRVRRNLQRLAALPKGWDGPGSVPISRTAINKARALISDSLTPMGESADAPFIVPMANGGLQIEWHAIVGEMELEIAPDRPSSIWVKDHSTGYEFEAEGPKAISVFFSRAAWLAKKPADGTDVSAQAAHTDVAVAA